MKTNCIAIDNDSNGLSTLSNYFSALTDYELIATFANPEEALKKLPSMVHVEILLINFEIFYSSDLELTKYFRTKIKKVIITSSNEKHAIDAFEYDANAFLLKPFSISKFVSTLDKLFVKEPTGRQSLHAEDDFFFIKSKNEKFNLIKIRPAEIISVESLQNYIAIQTINKKVIAHLTLTKIKEILKDQEDIIQVHRSFLISKRYIEEIESNVVKMAGNINITVGGDYRNELLSYIKQKTIQTGRTAVLNEKTRAKTSA